MAQEHKEPSGAQTNTRDLCEVRNTWPVSLQIAQTVAVITK